MCLTTNPVRATRVLQAQRVFKNVKRTKKNETAHITLTPGRRYFSADTRHPSQSDGHVVVLTRNMIMSFCRISCLCAVCGLGKQE